MCGIAGVRRLDGGVVDDSLVWNMIGRLSHRGPDGAGVWCEGSTGIGHRRLSIIDVQGSAQPMSSVDERLHLVFNGEILNYRQLRSSTPYPYRTSGDSEVLLAAFEKRRQRMVEELRGQFAFAIHDSFNEDLWLFRDRMGVLPLFWWTDGSTFAFASEIKALLPALPQQPPIDEQAVGAYLSQRAVPAPKTLLRGVSKLLPGHWLRVSPAGDISVEPYWQIAPHYPRRLPVEDAVEAVRRTLDDAVAANMVADVPVGAFLSGGVDSSLIVALMTSHRSGGEVETFSADFGDPRFDETGHAQRVSQLLRTTHHQVRVRPEDFSELWSRLTWHRDAPMSEPADVAVFRLAELARTRVKVVLSGEGSDELFGGYPKHRWDRWIRQLAKLPVRLRAPLLRAADQALPVPARQMRVALRAAAAEDEQARFRTWFAPFTDGERHELLGGNVNGGIGSVQVRGGDPLTRMLHFDCQSWLADNLLERGDRMCMAASLELRPPFLDHGVVEAAFSLPPEVKVRGRSGKWVLKEVARSYLPPEIVDRPKVGFRVPLDTWFRGGLRELAEEKLRAPGSFVRELFDRSAVDRVLAAHASGRRNEEMRIWTLLSLEVWHEVFFRSGDSRFPSSM